MPPRAIMANEMLEQFRGREEELVETLRNMQERAAIQKARTLVHKQAKRQAKTQVRTNRAAYTPTGAEPPNPTTATSSAVVPVTGTLFVAADADLAIASGDASRFRKSPANQEHPKSFLGGSSSSGYGASVPSRASSISSKSQKRTPDSRYQSFSSDSNRPASLASTVDPPVLEACLV